MQIFQKEKFHAANQVRQIFQSKNLDKTFAAEEILFSKIINFWLKFHECIKKSETLTMSSQFSIKWSLFVINLISDLTSTNFSCQVELTARKLKESK